VFFDADDEGKLPAYPGDDRGMVMSILIEADSIPNREHSWMRAAPTRNSRERALSSLAGIRARCPSESGRRCSPRRAGYIVDTASVPSNAP